MLNVYHLRDDVIVPVLRILEMNSVAAVQLLMGTAMTESQLQALKQHGRGPALGLWQMEPATHDDIWKNFLGYKPELAARVNNFALATRPVSKSEQMIGNLYYACAMARVHYYRVPAPLPAAGDVNGMAEYWKRYYNTEKGAGSVEQFVSSYQFLQKLYGQHVI